MRAVVNCTPQLPCWHEAAGLCYLRFPVGKWQVTLHHSHIASQIISQIYQSELPQQGLTIITLHGTQTQTGQSQELIIHFVYVLIFFFVQNNILKYNVTVNCHYCQERCGGDEGLLEAFIRVFLEFVTLHLAHGRSALQCTGSFTCHPFICFIQSLLPIIINKK